MYPSHTFVIGSENMYFGPTFAGIYVRKCGEISGGRLQSSADYGTGAGYGCDSGDAGKPVAPRKWRKQIVSEVSSPVERRGVDPGI